MKIRHILFTAALGLSTALPAISSSEHTHLTQKNMEDYFSTITANHLDELLAKANSGDESAQDDIIRTFCADKFIHLDFKSLNRDAWTVLAKYEANEELMDQYIRFALRIPGFDVTQMINHSAARAKDGNAEAMCNMGVACELGKGIAKDAKQSKIWYLKAAENGSARASFNLAMGFYSLSNFSEAAQHFRISAEKGFPLAMYRLGLLYEGGQGVGQDFIEAKKWYSYAAQKGHTSSLCSLAYFHIHGCGVEINKAEAARLLNIAEQYGNAMAISMLAQLCEGVDDAQAFIKYLIAAQKGDRLSQAEVGFRYETGKGVEQNLTSACDWYKKAAAQDVGYAQWMVGRFYRKGVSVDKDFKTAVEYLNQAVKSGCDDAYLDLGMVYSSLWDKGEACKDDELAVKYLRKAAEKGNADAIYYLGCAFDHGYGVSKNAAEAYRRYIQTGRSLDGVQWTLPVNGQLPEPKQPTMLASDHSSAISQLHYHANKYGIICTQMIAPIWQSACISFMDYVNQLSAFEHHLHTKPIMVTVFKPMADFADVIKEQFTPAYFHQYVLDDLAYVTIGDVNVSKVQVQLLDETNQAIGEEENLKSLPDQLLSYVFWNASRLLGHKDLCNKLSSMLVEKPGFASIETFGQAKTLLKIMADSHRTCLSNLEIKSDEYRVAFSNQGLVFEDQDWQNILESCKTDLNDSMRILRLKDSVENSHDQLLDQAIVHLKNKIKDSADQRNGICVLDPVYKAVVTIKNDVIEQ